MHIIIGHNDDELEPKRRHSSLSSVDYSYAIGDDDGDDDDWEIAKHRRSSYGKWCDHCGNDWSDEPRDFHETRPVVHATPVPIQIEHKAPNLSVAVERDDNSVVRLAKAMEDVAEAVRNLPADIAKHVKKMRGQDTRKKKKVKPAKKGFKGTKNSFMQKQLSEFHRYMLEHGYKYDARCNRRRAHACWMQMNRPDRSNPGKMKNLWDEAARVKGNKHGYSSYKPLADAYSRLAPSERAAL